jgi:uncharacterized Fe-S cluster protein YjdI
VADVPDDPRGRAYRGAELTVYFDARRCIHAAACVRGLPTVFDTGRRPWITVAGAPADAIVDVVERCPSGALTYERADGAAEAPARPTHIEREPGGPLHLRGDLLVATPTGDRRVTRATLCACGRSENAPFCDGSHRSAT